MGVVLGFAKCRRALVGVLLLGGCLPRGDLAGNSEGNLQQQPGALEQAPAQGLPGPEAPMGAEDASDPRARGAENAPSPVNLAPPGAPGDTSSAEPGTDAGSGTPDHAAVASTGDGAAVLSASSDAGSGSVDACTGAGGMPAPDKHTCVFILPQGLSWAGARAACAAQGRQLLSIKSTDLDAFVTSILTEDVWIGAHDPAMLDATSNMFVWLDGTPASTTNWAPGEPDAVANQYCITKTSAAPNGPWRDRPCTELKACLCEQTF